MKISQKLCARMDGTQLLLSWGFTVKIEQGNHKWAWVYIAYTLSNVVLKTQNFHNPPVTIVNWNFGFLLILDVGNVLKKCSTEKPCEVNAGDCSVDKECRGNLICTRNNCEGSTLSLYAKCCQEPGDDIFYISIWFTISGPFMVFMAFKLKSMAFPTKITANDPYQLKKIIKFWVLDFRF